MGRAAALAALASWQPDVIYAQRLDDLEGEAALLDLAPAVFFLHTYTGTCISGAKAFSRPGARACSRTFGWPCLAHYLPRRCGGRSPVTMLRLFRQQQKRLALLGRYRAVLTHSDHMREEAVRHGVQAAVVPFPVMERTLPVGARTDAEWRILFVGRMEPLKGGAVLLDALRLVSGPERRPIRAIFVGEGGERPRWEAQARGLADGCSSLHVEFTGWLPRLRIEELLSSVDLLAMPSLWPEPFGMVGPMAAQFGVPAAAFASGGIPQWLEDGVGGHLAPADPPTAEGLAAAVVQCLADPAHHAALRCGAMRAAARFTMRRHLPALLDALRRASAPGVPAAV